MRCRRPSVKGPGRGADAYDAAVVRREFARHESGETSGPIRWVRPAYGPRSLIGCTGAMAADGADHTEPARRGEG